MVYPYFAVFSLVQSPGIMFLLTIETPREVPDGEGEAGGIVPSGREVADWAKFAIGENEVTQA